MQTLLAPYISFRDTARQALEFYQQVFGGTIDVHTFSEYADSGMPFDPSESEKVMHGMIEAANGLTFMAADTPNGMEYENGSRITMSLSGDNEAELRGYWDKLADGGSVVMPLDKAPWGDTFGMVTDKFGIAWMVDIAPASTEATA
jgi:PhnB protein